MTNPALAVPAWIAFSGRNTLIVASLPTGLPPCLRHPNEPDHLGAHPPLAGQVSQIEGFVQAHE